MTPGDRTIRSLAKAAIEIRDSDLLLFRCRGLISIAGRGDHSHAAKAAWWGNDIDEWRPRAWNDVPPRAFAIEPVEDGLYSSVEAAVFASTFNELMLADERPLWVVAVPVSLRLEGDATSGMPIVGHVFDQDATVTTGG